MVHKSQANFNAVEKIANYAVKLRFEDLSELAVERARQIVLDTLGTGLGGYQTSLGKLTTAYAANMIPGSEASLLADGRRSTVEGAAWANAVMMKHLGMDDSSRTSGHVASQLVPAVLALAESGKLSGKTVMRALAAGYDVMEAIQPAVKDAQRVRGLDHKGQAGTLASAITAGVALGLDVPQMAHALALSADMACGTEQYVYDSGLCDTKDLLAGTAARNGITAAKMARFGFRGPPGALDGPYGYYHAFGGGYKPDYLDGIGTRFALAETGFKPHAGCRFVHACVDTVQDLVKISGRPVLDEIVSIEVGSYTEAITPDFRVDLNPPNQGLAGFSLPSAASIALVRGSFYTEDIAAYNDPQIVRLRQLVRVRLDPEMEAAYPKRNGCVVKLKMADGRQVVGRVDDAKGEPENMLTDGEFHAKFRRLVGNLLPPKQVDEIIALAAELEQLADAGELVRRTAVPGP